jgi:hypothetical protein
MRWHPSRALNESQPQVFDTELCRAHPQRDASDLPNQPGLRQSSETTRKHRSVFVSDLVDRSTLEVDYSKGAGPAA